MVLNMRELLLELLLQLLLFLLCFLAWISSSDICGIGRFLGATMDGVNSKEVYPKTAQLSLA